MQTTLKQAQQIVKQTVRSIAQQLLSHNNACIARDSSEGVVMYATVATTLQVFTQALQQLNATVTARTLAYTLLTSSTLCTCVRATAAIITHVVKHITAQNATL